MAICTESLRKWPEEPMLYSDVHSRMKLWLYLNDRWEFVKVRSRLVGKLPLVFVYSTNESVTIENPEESQWSLARPWEPPFIYFLYILQCADNTKYIGITNRPAHRLWQHNNSEGGRYTRAKSRKPMTMVHLETHPTRKSAAKQERALKKLSPGAKSEIILQSADRTDRYLETYGVENKIYGTTTRK